MVAANVWSSPAPGQRNRAQEKGAAKRRRQGCFPLQRLNPRALGKGY